MGSPFVLDYGWNTRRTVLYILVSAPYIQYWDEACQPIKRRSTRQSECSWPPRLELGVTDSFIRTPWHTGAKILKNSKHNLLVTSAIFQLTGCIHPPPYKALSQNPIPLLPWPLDRFTQALTVVAAAAPSGSYASTSISKCILSPPSILTPTSVHTGE